MDGEAALLVDHRVARIRATMPADDEVRITREQVDNFALAFVAPMTSDNRGYGHGTYFTSQAAHIVRVRRRAARQIGFRVSGSAAHIVRVRGSAARPPGASRCFARASLRTPSRPHPPHEDALRAI